MDSAMDQVTATDAFAVIVVLTVLWGFAEVFG
jgi:hypothetical protein